jgi:hypothetical protein
VIPCRGNNTLTKVRTCYVKTGFVIQKQGELCCAGASTTETGVLPPCRLNHTETKTLAKVKTAFYVKVLTTLAPVPKFRPKRFHQIGPSSSIRASSTTHPEVNLRRREVVLAKISLSIVLVFFLCHGIRWLFFLFLFFFFLTFYINISAERPLFLLINTQTMYNRSIAHGSIAWISLKNLTPWRYANPRHLFLRRI